MVVVLLGGISFLYPFILRKIPLLKIFVISFVWSASSMLLLILENSIIISQNEIIHLLARFLFVFSITIPFDIRDIFYDTKNIATIPLFFGVKKAKWIAFLALIICVSLSFIQYFDGTLNQGYLLALIFLYFITSFFIFRSDTNSEEMYFSFWGEGVSICAYLFLVISLLIY